MSDRDKYKRAAKGDIAYNMMRLWQGAVGVAPVDGLVSPAYVVARPYPEVDSRYYAYLFRTAAYMNEVDKYSHGIVKDRNRLYWDEFKQMPSPFPPTDEQQRIARFLDEHGRQVSAFIRNKRRLIELLNEQKQAIVNRAVTRGVDASTRLVSSGVGGLGEVPAHWLIRPLKRWARINHRTLPESTSPDYVFRYVDIGTVGTGFLTEQPEYVRFGTAPSRARRILTQGDTIISTVRTYLKAVYFVSEDADDLVASTGFAVLSPGADVVPEYLGYAIQSAGFIERVTANSVGVAYPAIAESRLGALHLALPPTQGEQSRIVEQIKARTQSLDGAIDRARRELNLILEYRTRLIADVVTGKVDVRRLAPGASPVSMDGHEPFADLADALMDDADGALVDGDDPGDVEEAAGADD